MNLQQFTIWTMGACLLATTQVGMAGTESCCFLNPPDQSLDLPDDNYMDSNGDGIDGMRCGPIFVSTFGSDNNIGTIDEPMRTIGAAILAASQLDPVRDVYVAGGEYMEAVVLANGVNLYSGYDDGNDWARSTSPRATARLEHLDFDAQLVANGLTDPVLIDHFLLIPNRDPDAAFPGSSNIAAIVRDCTSTVTFNFCDLVAQLGTDGINGTSGISGTPGENGANAVGNTGGNGGLGSLGEANKGGVGGAGGAQFSCKSKSGCCTELAEPGADGSGSNPGTGGGFTGDQSPQPGTAGANGQNGINGAGGIRFTSPDGGDGSGSGTDGSGGGGGAGGQIIIPPIGCFEAYGGGGGGGGGGGTAGTDPGTGGTGGGSACSLIVLNAHVDLLEGVLIASIGGDGGDGGSGGAGGLGGLGGLGAPGTPGADDGANGGRGGNGGSPGHGGGGAGGDSIAVLLLNGGSATADQDSFFFNVGGGAGGSSNGNPGQSGVGALTHVELLNDVPYVSSCAPCCVPTNVHTRIVMENTEPDATATVQLATENGLEDAGSVSIITPPAFGDAFVIGNEITYLPKSSSFTGLDWLEYDACRTCGECVIGYAVIHVYSDYNNSGIADSCECLPDIAPLGGNGTVNVDDLLVLIGEWGASKSIADLNGSGIVNVDDLLILIGAWGPCP